MADRTIQFSGRAYYCGGSNFQYPRFDQPEWIDGEFEIEDIDTNEYGTAVYVWDGDRVMLLEEKDLP